MPNIPSVHHEVGLGLGCDAFGYQAGAGTNARAVFVLAHGLGATAELGFSSEISKTLLAEGYEVYRTEVPAFESVEASSTALAAQVDAILSATGKDKIHIIGHSMGGLDARYLISSLGYGDSVASLTTVATPHRGSPIADYVLEEDQDGMTKLDLLADVFGDDDATRETTRRAVVDLSVARSEFFNA